MIDEEGPTTRKELLTRAKDLAGYSLGDLASAIGEDTPESLGRAKGWVGRLLERSLGADGGNYAGPDFRELAIELKTLPVDRKGQVKESTYVCTVDLMGEEISWEASRARAKLKTVLWIPIEVGSAVPIKDRRVGSPLLWSPSAKQEKLLEADWTFLMDLIRRGLVDEISGRDGRILQIRPKAANARKGTGTLDEEGNWTMTLPRGFYLRARFTESLLRTYAL